jgi:tRNA A37 threonylcarbamoyltransferase TsaD
MSKARDEYYKLKIDVFMVSHEGLVPAVENYVSELEQQKERSNNIIYELNNDNINLKQQKTELIKWLEEELQDQISICGGIENVDKSLVNLVQKYSEEKK